MFTSRSRTSYISRKRNKKALAYLAQLLLLLQRHFDEEEFRVLCFELSVDYQDLPGSGRAAKMEEFLMLQAREGHVDSLVAICRERRERVPWPDRPESVSKTDLMLAATKDKPISKERRHKLMLLERVNKIWIEGVFANSVHHHAVIELNKRSLETAVAEDNSWQMVLAKPGDELKQLPPDTHILDVFVEMDETLLVLGEPGAGKTTTLLQLANELIEQARLNPEFPIPVIFSLSTWQGEPLGKWLATELNNKYKIPKEIAHDWVAEDDLLLLLDGLDEVPAAQQEACIAAINDFRTKRGFTGMVVCSRAQEYEALTARLQFGGAVVLEPLTEAQVEDYLAKVAPNSRELHQRLLQDAALKELTKSPLMLSVMSVSYGNSAENKQPPATLQDGREQLFDTYVKQMLARVSNHNQFSPQQTLMWLNNLAQKLRQHNKTAFFMEEMQPSWLPKKQQYFHSMIVKIIIILLFAFSAGLYVVINSVAFGLGINETFLDILFFSSVQGFSVVIIAAIILIVDRWVPTWLALIITTFTLFLLDYFITPPNLWIGFMYGLAAGGTAVSTINNNQIKIITINFSWRKALRGVFIAVFGFIGMNLAGNSMVLSIITLVVFLFGLLSIIPLGLSGQHAPLDETVYPNQGMNKSAYNAVKLGGAVFVITLLIGLLIAVVFASFEGEGVTATLLDSIFISMIFGVPLTLILTLYYGGTSFIQQFVLRVQLAQANLIPLKTSSFLNYTTRCVFLQKVGGGYIFIHRFFLEYFADPELQERKYMQEMG